MLTGVAASLRMLQQEESGVDEIDQPAALGESAGGRIEGSQAMRWRQPESQAAQPLAAIHVVSPFAPF